MTASLHKISLSISTGIDKPLIELLAEPLPHVTIPEKEYLTLKHGVGYWQALHKKVIEREKISKQKIKELEGEIRGLKSRLFGNSNEQGKSKNNEGQSIPSPSPRPRGQQPGSKGHGRTLKYTDASKIFYVNNPAVKAMGERHALIFLKKKN